MGHCREIILEWRGLEWSEGKILEQSKKRVAEGENREEKA